MSWNFPPLAACSLHATVDRVRLTGAWTVGTSRVANSRPAGTLLLFGCRPTPPEVCGTTPGGLATVGGASCRPVSIRPAALFPVCCKGLVSTWGRSTVSCPIWKSWGGGDEGGEFVRSMKGRDWVALFVLPRGPLGWYCQLPDPETNTYQWANHKTAY